MAGLTLITLLVAAPAAGASTVSVSGSSALYTGDPSDDTVTLRIDSNDDGDGFYFFDDDDGVSAEPPCFERRSGRRAVCRITDGLGYEIDTGDGADKVTITDDAPGGSTDLGTGNDSFAGGGAADTAAGGDGDDVLKGGAGNDDLSGGAGTDQVGGEGGADAVRGGPGNDQLEFGGDQMAPGAGLGADVIEGGLGFDRLSYNDHAAGVRVSLDDRAGDGSAGENDNVRGDVEVVVGSTLDDTLTGNDGAQQLFGNAGFDRIDGLGGDDIVNGGTGGDELYGGGGRDRMEGSAGEDYLEGGAGEDIFEGDNVCTAEPCTGGSDFIQAVDGEADTVNCGVGADTALVDDIDVVAVDTQHGCERVERSATGSAPAPAAPAAPAAGGGVVGGAAFEPRLHVRGVRRLATLRRGKFRLEVSCPGSCKVKARLISGRTVVATKSRLRLGAGAVVLKPRLNKLGRRLLKHRTRVALTLAVDVTDDQGRVVTLVRSLRFRR